MATAAYFMPSRDEEFSAVCFWEMWLLTWGAIADTVANDLAFDRAQLLVDSLEASRDERDAARARLAKPTMADVQRVLRESLSYHARTCNAGRQVPIDVLDRLVTNLVGNATYAVAGLFGVEE